MRKVLVLRPEPGASATADALRTAGFEPIAFPLSEIRPLAVDSSFDLESLGRVAATSANALRHAPPDLIVRLRALPFHGVGEATADAARAAGFRIVTSEQGDAASLARAIIQSSPGAARGDILYLCGHIRRPEFEAVLAEAGLTFRVLETYDTVFPDRSSGFGAMLDANPDIFAVLLHSREAAKAFVRLADAPPSLRFVAISDRAGQPLEELGYGVISAGEPTEDAMLAALSQLR